MTSETPDAVSKPAEGTDVDRARAELVSALTELEDKVNIPKRVRRFREEEPNKFLATAGAAATAVAGVVALGVFAVVHRRH